MLLVVDIGNTNITFGIYDEEILVDVFRMTTPMPRTSDEYGILIREMVIGAGVKVTEVKEAIIASVVPDIMYSFVGGLKKYLGITPITLGPGVKTGVKLGAENPKEVGADLIADAAAVREIYGTPAIVIDFGSATTYEFVLEDGTLDAVVITPGIKMSAAALSGGTAKVPDVEIKRPKSILAKETIACVQAGLFFGNIGQTDYIVRKMKEEAVASFKTINSIDDIKVVATGGLGKVIADEAEAIDIYDNTLTLRGLQIIHKRTKGK